MAVHLHRDLEQLKKEVAQLGAMVEEATQKAVLALTARRADLAGEVLDGDREIDRKEVHLEEECLKVLALHQPVANDLRFVVAILKVDNDLERVGDLAGNMAERAAFLASRPAITIPEQLTQMAAEVPVMLRNSLNALLGLDVESARNILRQDEVVDQQHAELYDVLGGRMREDPEHIEELMQLLSVSRYLERIADLATNIAEDVVFLVEGTVVRHLSW